MANPGTYQDGDGLFLKVGKSGAASWLVRLQQEGKRRDIGLGSAKLLTLAEAREKAGQLRKAIKVEKRDVLAERKDEAAARVTFRDAALCRSAKFLHRVAPQTVLWAAGAGIAHPHRHPVAGGPTGDMVRI